VAGDTGGVRTPTGGERGQRGRYRSRDVEDDILGHTAGDPALEGGTLALK